MISDISNAVGYFQETKSENLKALFKSGEDDRLIQVEES